LVQKVACVAIPLLPALGKLQADQVVRVLGAKGVVFPVADDVVRGTYAGGKLPCFFGIPHGADGFDSSHSMFFLLGNLCILIAEDLFAEIPPIGIFGNNQHILFASCPAFQLFFSGDGVVYVLKDLVINGLTNVKPFGVAIDQVLLMLLQPTGKAVGNAYVNTIVTAVGKYISVVHGL
jgi:hypothetical protein